MYYQYNNILYMNKQCRSQSVLESWVKCLSVPIYTSEQTSIYGAMCKVHFCYYYVRELQLPHAVNTSHTTPTIHVNWGPMLFETDWWRHCLCFKWVPHISGTTTQSSDVEPGRTARYSIIITI